MTIFQLFSSRGHKVLPPACCSQIVYGHPSSVFRWGRLYEPPSTLTDILFSVDLNEDPDLLWIADFNSIGCNEVFYWNPGMRSFCWLFWDNPSLISGRYQRVLRVFSVTVWLPRNSRCQGLVLSLCCYSHRSHPDCFYLNSLFPL